MVSRGNPSISTEQTTTKERTTPSDHSAVVASVATTNGTPHEQLPPGFPTDGDRAPLDTETSTSTSKATNPPADGSVHANVQGPPTGDMPPPPLDPIVIVIQGNPSKKSANASFERSDSVAFAGDDLPPSLSPSMSITSIEHIYESITSLSYTPQWFECTSNLHIYEEIAPVPALNLTLEGPGSPFIAWFTPKCQEVGKKRKRKKRSPAGAILRAPVKMAKKVKKKAKKVKKMVKKKFH